MLCGVCCKTEPNAIKSLTGVRFSVDEYPSPKYDASATALGGAFEISVKIFTSFSFDHCVVDGQIGNIELPFALKLLILLSLLSYLLYQSTKTIEALLK